MEKLEECPNCGEAKRWLYDAQCCAACDYDRTDAAMEEAHARRRAQLRPHITIGMYTLRRLARGEAVVIDGVALFAASDMPSPELFEEIRNVISMDFLRAHDRPGATGPTEDLDLVGAVREMVDSGRRQREAAVHAEHWGIQQKRRAESATRCAQTARREALEEALYDAEHFAAWHRDNVARPPPQMPPEFGVELARLSAEIAEGIAACIRARLDKETDR